jgi:hypothetical protein
MLWLVQHHVCKSAMYKASCVSTNVLFTQHIAAHGNEQTPVLRATGVHSGVHFICDMSRLDVTQPLRVRVRVVPTWFGREGHFFTTCSMEGVPNYTWSKGSLQMLWMCR